MTIEYFQLGQHKIIVHIPQFPEEVHVMEDKCHIVVGDKCQPILLCEYESDKLATLRWALSILFRKDKEQPLRTRRSSNIYGRRIRSGNRR